MRKLDPVSVRRRRSQAMSAEKTGVQISLKGAKPVCPMAGFIRRYAVPVHQVNIAIDDAELHRHILHHLDRESGRVLPVGPCKTLKVELLISR